jgi:RNA polymerase sigma factor (TIGR02999 family)
LIDKQTAGQPEIEGMSDEALNPIPTAGSDVTVILNAAQQGDVKAAEELLPLIYEELRRLAAVKLAQEKTAVTLQPTALVHEAWLRLVGGSQDRKWNGRGHFFGAAAEAMRRILIERARRKAAVKRGAGWERVDLDNVDIAADANNETLLLVDEALAKLQQEDPKAAELVKLRFFGGLTLQESGELLGFSERTAKRCWAFARAWLYAEMQKLAAG